jgi:flagellar biosynthetic protein FlhB
MAELFGDKQHEPTPHRREQAREEGQIVQSHDLAAAAVLVAGVCIVLYLGSGIVEYVAGYARRQLGEPVWQGISRDTVYHEWHVVIWQLARHLAPLLGLMLLVGVLAHVGQSGFLWLPKNLSWDIGRVSPLRGARRLFSLSNAVRLALGIFKLMAVAGVAYACLRDRRDDLLTASELEVGQLARFLVDLTLGTCLKVGLALLLLALLDYLFQWWKHEQDLRMTTQEIREEMKLLQGDPQLAVRRKAVQRQLAMQRISSAVPKADVIVTNPTELAVAIQYDPLAMDAPVVVAKGAGTLAQRIRRLALESGIPIVERKELARHLYRHVDVGKPIPAEQYAAMAEVLRYVYQLKGKTLPRAS